MKVGIDYLPAVTHWPGVGRYARELVRALAALEPSSREEVDPLALALYDVGGEARAIGEPALGIAGRAHVTRVSRRVPRRIVERWARLTGRGADRALGGVDLFHRIWASYPPVGEVPQTMAVGELPPVKSAAHTELGPVLRSLAGLLVPSRYGESELVKRFGLAPERVHHVSLGCEHWRRDFSGPPPPKTGAPTLLVLGSVRPERRHALILSAFEGLLAKHEAARMVFVGGGEGGDRERLEGLLRFSSAQEAVHWIREPVERDLPQLVADAWVLVHLSEGELSAVTPLEAFSFGTAVVTNPGGAFAEALGTEARYFDATSRKRPDVNKLAAEIRAALESAADAAAFERRIALASQFTWEQSARKTVEAWRRVLALGT